MHDPFVIALPDINNHAPANLETVFSIGNGHFGIRASDPLSHSATGGTIVNGFFETAPITYGESAYGYAKNHQTIINLPDLRAVTVTDEAGTAFTTQKLVSQELDLHTGLLTTEMILATLDGKRLHLQLTEAIGQTNQNVAALQYTFTPLSFSGKITVTKKLAFYQAAVTDDDPRRARAVQSLQIDDVAVDQGQAIQITTASTHLRVQMALSVPETTTLDLTQNQATEFFVGAEVGPVGTADGDYPTSVLPPDLGTVAEDGQQYWQQVWAQGTVDITGDKPLAQGIHYNIFQLNSSAGRDGHTNISAKGVSGVGYEGHYFWDTEMYMLPYFILTQPTIAKQLLAYRYHILPQAKERARTLGVTNGALFAWRTINGEEASAYYPAGTAQYHIDADIAYGIGQYYAATGDLDFMTKVGFEMIVETARFWANFGSWFIKDGKKAFGFFDVTGPDEYTALVDNNYYTNRMAQHNLELVGQLIKAFQDAGQALPVSVSEKEQADFEIIADNIYLPYNQEHQINAQDDSFFDKPVWPFAETPKENYPLLLHYHPLMIYRHQVNKQADTLLADYLFFDDVPTDQLQREYDYYESVTTHDSSLSRAIFSALAARLGMGAKAYSYFMDTARMDLTDLQGNTADGLHLANLGGSWLSIVTGFAGLHYTADNLTITNHLPENWEKLAFKCQYQGRQLQVSMSHFGTEVTVLAGDPLDITIDGVQQKIAAQ
ncbi:glycoside hydrolase family 65 protein [Schleiferilactobacillus harbinensis]|uniref:Glycosyl hydrolase family 65 protein n=1 Tax=Schleiferilactobacillus harbinensis TaxID=304207 RepID=A0ABU7T3J0_9LACO